MGFLSKTDKKIFILLDPDSGTNYSDSFFQGLDNTLVKGFLVGGSLVTKQMGTFIDYLRSKTTLPIYIFPGACSQISDNADGLLLLGLLSGRNAEFIIGEHVKSAVQLKRSKLDVLSTAYILVDGGNETSVSYMSNTRPIPAPKTDIILSTAIAAELIGYKQIYLEAGSGAINPVPKAAVATVASQTSLPLIVGGGIRDISTISDMFEAGANAVVIGTKIEQNPTFISELKKFIA